MFGTYKLNKNLGIITTPKKPPKSLKSMDSEYLVRSKIYFLSDSKILNSIFGSCEKSYRSGGLVSFEKLTNNFS